VALFSPFTTYLPYLRTQSISVYTHTRK